MIPINNQIRIINTISSGLCQDLLDLRAGKITIKKADSISRIAGKTIKSIAEGVMLANHQEIQREKVSASIQRTESMDKNTDFKNRKLNLKYGI